MKRSLDILTALANKSRLLIFLILLERDLCVCELQQILGMEQSRLSHQLRLLRYLGLVTAKQKEKWTVYSVPKTVKRNRIIQSIRESTKLPRQEREKLTKIEMTSRRSMKRALPNKGGQR